MGPAGHTYQFLKNAAKNWLLNNKYQQMFLKLNKMQSDEHIHNCVVLQDNQEALHMLTPNILGDHAWL